MLARHSALFALLLLVAAFPVKLLAEIPPLNQKIVQFCQENLGKKVGDGDCFDLASHAFRQVGASRGFKAAPNKGDFVWGRLACHLEASDGQLKCSGTTPGILPGDIIQFRDTKFKSKKHGQHYGHHTAVVCQARENGAELKLLQQNFGGKKFVTEQTLHPMDLKQGWIRVYRPVAKKNKDADKD